MNPSDHGGIIHGTTQFGDQEFGASWRHRHTRGDRCRICNCPVQNWNDGKRQEFKDRQVYRMEG